MFATLNPNTPRWRLPINWTDNLIFQLTHIFTSKYDRCNALLCHSTTEDTSLSHMFTKYFPETYFTVLKLIMIQTLTLHE